MTEKELLEYFEKLEFTWWEREDIMDLIEDNPDLLNDSIENLESTVTHYFWEAQNLIEEADSLEAKGDALKKYILIRKARKMLDEKE